MTVRPATAGPRRAARALAAAAALLGAAPAAAQTAVADDPAFSVERFTPAPGHATFGAVEDPDVLPAGRWAAGIWAIGLGRPIVLRHLRTGEDATVPVEARLGVELHAAVGLGARYQLGLAVPAAVQRGDRLRGTGLGEAPLAGAVAGDLRLHARARLAGAPGDRGFAAALAAALTLPTGDDDHFAGEAGPVVEWRLALGWRGARAAAAANLGVRVRSREVVLLSPARPHGNELVTGAAAEVALPGLGRALTLPGAGPRAWAIGEVAWVHGDEVGGRRGPSPGELRGGLRLALGGGWSVTVLGGAGVTPSEVGSPAWRIAIGVVRDRAPLDDLDGDGVIDARDLCPRAPEDRDGWQDDDGCPDPDNDGDGIPDPADACPDHAEDVDGYRDGDGCPDDETHVAPPDALVPDLAPEADPEPAPAEPAPGPSSDAGSSGSARSARAAPRGARRGPAARASSR